MKKTNLIYGVLGFILGGVITFLVFYSPTNEIQNAEGKLVDCPTKQYRVGEMITSQCSMRPEQHCTYQDRGGCNYILRNVGPMTIQTGQTVEVTMQMLADDGSQYLEVEHPRDGGSSRKTNK